MTLRSAPRRGEDEDGAMAVIVGLLVDRHLRLRPRWPSTSARLAMERQQLHDHVDCGRARRGLRTAGRRSRRANGGARAWRSPRLQDLDDSRPSGPEHRLCCVVASTGVPRRRCSIEQIPSTCNPGAGRRSPRRATRACGATPTSARSRAAEPRPQCNTIEVNAEKDVPFGFARHRLRAQGTTGSVASAACKGSCGQRGAEPARLVIMADRTASMASDDRAQMKMADRHQRHIDAHDDDPTHALPVASGRIAQDATPTYDAAPARRRPRTVGANDRRTLQLRRGTPRGRTADRSAERRCDDQRNPSDASRDHGHRRAAQRATTRDEEHRSR